MYSRIILTVLFISLFSTTNANSREHLNLTFNPLKQNYNVHASQQHMDIFQPNYVYLLDTIYNNLTLITLGSCEGNCINGFGKYTYEEGVIYKGFFRNSVPHGYGIMLLSNNDAYAGHYYNGLRDGFGVYTFAESKEMYVGYWKKNQQHGYGFYRDVNNKAFEGGIYTKTKLTTNLLTDFLNNKSSDDCLGNCIDGYGEKTYEGNERYYGFFKGGKFYKVGEYLWDDLGCGYVGTYGKGQNTYGMFTTPDHIYSGEFDSKAQYTGLGMKHDIETGVQVYGEFKDGKLVVDYANGYKP